MITNGEKNRVFNLYEDIHKYGNDHQKVMAELYQLLKKWDARKLTKIGKFGSNWVYTFHGFLIVRAKSVRFGLCWKATDSNNLYLEKLLSEIQLEISNQDRRCEARLHCNHPPQGLCSNCANYFCDDHGQCDRELCDGCLKVKEDSYEETNRRLMQKHLRENLLEQAKNLYKQIEDYLCMSSKEQKELGDDWFLEKRKALFGALEILDTKTLVRFAWITTEVPHSETQVYTYKGVMIRRSSSEINPWKVVTFGSTHFVISLQEAILFVQNLKDQSVIVDEQIKVYEQEQQKAQKENSMKTRVRLNCLRDFKEWLGNYTPTNWTILGERADQVLKDPNDFIFLYDLKQQYYISFNTLKKWKKEYQIRLKSKSSIITLLDKFIKEKEKTDYQITFHRVSSNPSCYAYNENNTTWKLAKVNRSKRVWSLLKNDSHVFSVNYFNNCKEKSIAYIKSQQKKKTPNYKNYPQYIYYLSALNDLKKTDKLMTPYINGYKSKNGTFDELQKDFAINAKRYITQTIKLSRSGVFKQKVLFTNPSVIHHMTNEQKLYCFALEQETLLTKYDLVAPYLFKTPSTPVKMSSGGMNEVPLTDKKFFREDGVFCPRDER